MKGQENHIDATLVLMDVVGGLDNLAYSMAATTRLQPNISLAESAMHIRQVRT